MLAEARPSASVVLLSATNEVPLLQRVATSSAFHDGPVPAADSPAYRMAAVREFFEETGILLARWRGDGPDGGKRDDGGPLIDLPGLARAAARRRIHASEVAFGDWLASVNAVADTDNLVPFTRWITPASMARCFSTQMYLYMLPLSPSGQLAASLMPTADGGIEHTAALFAAPATWLTRAAERTVTLLPPQFYLLQLLSTVLAHEVEADVAGPALYAAQRRRLLAWLRQQRPSGADAVAWADKAICPCQLPVRCADGRRVLGLEAPGPELRGSGRAGDAERVLLARFAATVPSELELQARAHVLGEGEPDADNSTSGPRL